MERHANEAKERENGQEEVPHCQGSSQVPRLARGEILLSIVNHGKISSNRHGRKPRVVFHPVVNMLQVVLELPAEDRTTTD